MGRGFNRNPPRPDRTTSAPTRRAVVVEHPPRPVVVEHPSPTATRTPSHLSLSLPPQIGDLLALEPAAGSVVIFSTIEELTTWKYNDTDPSSSAPGAELNVVEGMITEGDGSRRLEATSGRVDTKCAYLFSAQVVTTTTDVWM